MVSTFLQTTPAVRSEPQRRLDAFRLQRTLLAMRRAPGLATLAAALSLVGWIPWSALIALDDLAYQIAQAGSSPELGALWPRFSGDPVMVTYLLIYVVGHLLSAVLIGVLL